MSVVRRAAAAYWILLLAVRLNAIVERDGGVSIIETSEDDPPVENSGAND